MHPPFEELAALDRLIHEPARLAILTALSACRSADFLYLQRLTGLTKGNLSSHLGKLEEAGLIAVEKRFIGKQPRTTLRATRSGRDRLAAHWARLAELRHQSASWEAEAAFPASAASGK
jgi:DNA-binding transcriptional ArsR family regulator